MPPKNDVHVTGVLQHVQPGRVKGDYAELIILVDWSDPEVKLAVTRWEGRKGLKVRVSAEPDG